MPVLCGSRSLITRVPFGLANSPAVFKRLMHEILGDLRHREVLVYMDDLLIPSHTIDQGVKLLDNVLELVEQSGVKLDLEKCSFLQTKVEYLGHKISAEGAQPGQNKVRAVVQFPVPDSVQ